MSFIPKPHEIYKHFKGNLYQITAIAEHTETGEALVVYQAMYGDFKTYARPLTMFISPVDREKYPDAEQEFRFELQGPDAARQKAEMSACIQAGSEKSDIAAPVEKSVEPESAGKMGHEYTDSNVLSGQVEQKHIESKESSGQEQADSIEAAEQEPANLKGQSGQEQADSMEVLGQIPQEQLSSDTDEDSEGFYIDPMVLEFLDADSYEQRLNILTGLRHRITDDMITTMAIACDVEIGEGDIEERYESLKACLVTMERYECNRLR